MRVLARIRQDAADPIQGANVLDARRESSGKLGRPGSTWRVERAVRHAGRFLFALTLVVRVVLPMGVAVEVGVECRCPMARALTIVVPIGVCDPVLMEMSQRGEGREKEKRGELQTANHGTITRSTHDSHSLRSSD